MSLKVKLRCPDFSRKIKMVTLADGDSILWMDHELARKVGQQLIAAADQATTTTFKPVRIRRSQKA